jgi:(+)-trans-carveol dehydrogenase
MRADLTKARGGKAIQVDTTMIQDEATWRVFRPDLEHPTESDFAAAS